MQQLWKPNLAYASRLDAIILLLFQLFQQGASASINIHTSFLTRACSEYENWSHKYRHYIWAVLTLKKQELMGGCSQMFPPCQCHSGLEQTGTWDESQKRWQNLVRPLESCNKSCQTSAKLGTLSCTDTLSNPLK